MGILSKNGPKIVYLDQCALGELFCSKPRPAWVSLLDLLRRGVESGRLTLPLSAEHLLETGAIPDPTLAELRRRQMFELTRYAMFVPSEVAVARQLFASVKGRRIDRGDVLGTLLPEMASKPMAFFSERKRMADEDYANCHQFHNSIVKPRGIIRPEDRADILMIHESRAREVFDGITSVLNALTYIGPFREIILARCNTLMRRETVIVNELLALDPTPADISVLRLLLETGQDSDVHVLDVAGKLTYYANLKQLRRKKGDYYDLHRLEVAIPYADVVITDGKQVVAIKEQGLERRYGTQVFSCSPDEDSLIISAIEGLLS